MRRAAVIGVLLLTWCLPYAAHAQQQNEIRITPQLIDTSETVTSGLQASKAHKTTKLEGDGGQALRIVYGSTDSLDIYLVPLEANGEYNPIDFLHFTLPAAGEGQVLIDLTVSPGWSPNIKTYLVNILVKDESVQAGFYSAEFVPASPLTLLVTAVKHFFVAESYAPNSYHALRGYRMLGAQFTLGFGCLALLAMGIVFIRKRSADRVRIAVGMLACFCLLYGARFTLDLLRFSMQHVSEYYGNGMYDEAGAIGQIADLVKTTPAPQSVYVCRDASNFREKLLRYFAYPVQVSDSPAMASGSTLILLDGKINSTFQDGMLDCGGAHTRAELLRTFQDGSSLFRRLPAKS